MVWIKDLPPGKRRNELSIGLTEKEPHLYPKAFSTRPCLTGVAARSPKQHSFSERGGACAGRVADGSGSIASAAKDLGVTFQAVPTTYGSHVRGMCPVQTVNQYHARLKSWLSH